MPSKPILDTLAIIDSFYSDCELVCGVHKFKVDRIILHDHSNYFAEFFSDRLTDDQPSNGSKQLQDDDPAVLGAMLEYFYKSTYPIPPHTSALKLHTDVLLMAEKYGAPALEAAVLTRSELACDADEWTTEELVEVPQTTHCLAHSGQIFTLEQKIAAVTRRNLHKIIESKNFCQILTEMPDWNVGLLKCLDCQCEDPRTHKVRYHFV